MSMRPLLRRKELQAILGLGRTKIYHMITDGELPKPIRIGPRALRWRPEDIDEWLDNQPKDGEDNS